MGKGNIAIWKSTCRTTIITRGMSTFYCWYKRWRWSTWWRRKTWRWNQRWSSADSGRRWKKWRRWKVGGRSSWREKWRWFAKIVVYFSSRSFRKDLYVAVFICPSPYLYY